RGGRVAKGVPGAGGVGGPQEPLRDLRVTESAGGLACAYGGFLLAELGAAVQTLRAAGGPVLDRRKGRGAAEQEVDAVLWDEQGPALHAAAPVRCRVSAWGERRPRRRLPP